MFKKYWKYLLRVVLCVLLLNLVYLTIWLSGKSVDIVGAIIGNLILLIYMGIEFVIVSIILNKK